MSKKNLLRIVLPIALIAAVGIGFYAYLHQKPAETDTLRLFGNIDIRQVRLAFHNTGRIAQILVDEGTPVKAGSLIAQLDPFRFEAAVAEARARVAAQKQTLAALLAGSRSEEIGEVEARVRSADATLADAEQIYRRTRILADTEYVSQQKLDDAKAALVNAHAGLDAARQRFNLTVKGPRQEDIAAAQAKLEQFEAALQRVEEQLTDTRLRAPADGIIQNRILEPGDMAFPQTPVLTLALTNPIWVRAYVSEPDLGKVVPGMSVNVHTDSFPEKTYRGWIGFISPTAEFTPKRIETTELRSKLVYQVRAFVCNPSNELRLGMPATVDVLLNGTQATVDLSLADPCQGE